MTNKEAIYRIREHIEIHKEKEPRAVLITEALEMAIKALYIEPYEDYISREAAKLKVANVVWEVGDIWDTVHDKCVDCLDELPPLVTPKENVGEWIVEKYRKCLPFDSGIGFTEDEEYDEKTHTIVSDRTVCSKCRYILKSELDKTNYCPNCGANMKGSEGKE